MLCSPKPFWTRRDQLRFPASPGVSYLSKWKFLTIQNKLLCDTFGTALFSYFLLATSFKWQEIYCLFPIPLDVRTPFYPSFFQLLDALYFGFHLGIPLWSLLQLLKENFAVVGRRDAGTDFLKDLHSRFRPRPQIPQYHWALPDLHSERLSSEKSLIFSMGWRCLCLFHFVRLTELGPIGVDVQQERTSSTEFRLKNDANQMHLVKPKWRRRHPWHGNHWAYKH